MLQRTRYIALFSALLILLGTGGAKAKKQSFDELSAEIITQFEAFYPVRATQLGFHSYDSRLADYSSGSVKKMISKLKWYHKELRRFRNADLDADQSINYRLLEANLNTALLELDKLKIHKRLPHRYIDEAVNGAYYLLISNYASLGERLYPLLDRMRDVPRLLSNARKNIKKAPSVHIKLAKERLDNALDFYSGVAAELMSRFPERADEILKVSTQTREALTEFGVYLDELPQTGADDIAIGQKNYDYLLSHELLLTDSSETLLQRTEMLLAGVNEEYKQFVAYVEDNHQNGTDSVFVPATFSRSDILDYYQWEVDQVRLFAEINDFVSIPPDLLKLQVVETPHFLRSFFNGTAYEPVAPADTGSIANLYVRPIPEQLDAAQLAAHYRYVHRRGFRDRVVREAYPGRHLQWQVAFSLDDPVRQWQRNSLTSEGWSLYCEEEMYRQGLYGVENPAQWLIILRDLRFATALAVADIKLHTGRLSFEECIDWMSDALEIDTESGRSFVRSEIERLSYLPCVPLSAVLGRLELQQLRQAAANSWGDEFSLRRFHDVVLTEGMIPPALLREALALQ